MLMPHPAVLRGLLEEYEAAAANESADATGEPGPRTRDLAYTLCVSTGTRDVRQALETARRHLAEAVRGALQSDGQEGTGRHSPAEGLSRPARGTRGE
ncbi:DUF5133 domain-containing protein [Streptomyces sp. NPDC018026]|uniref:DUF5133 domain-containing protein n=1 Tax=Streptomyces sp. NPDC018026 TaxID=3365031 RepID=UPI003796CD7B